MIQRGVASTLVGAALMIAACTGADGDELVDVRESLAEDEDVEAAPTEAEASDVTEAEPESVEEGSETDPGASAETPEEPTEDVDITTVPDEITVEYVQAVIDELERIVAEALIIMMEEGELTIEVTDRIGEIFATDQLSLRTQELTETAETGFSGLREQGDLRPRVRRVQELIDANSDCIYAESRVDERGLFEDGDADAVSFVVLRRPEVDRGLGINESTWVYASLAIGDESELRNQRPCTG